MPQATTKVSIAEQHLFYVLKLRFRIVGVLLTRQILSFACLLPSRMQGQRKRAGRCQKVDKMATDHSMESNKPAFFVSRKIFVGAPTVIRQVLVPHGRLETKSSQ